MIAAHTTRAWLCALLTLAALGCIGGQSGGEIETDPPTMESNFAACPCVIGDSAAAAIATLESADMCGVAVTIDELIGEAGRVPYAVGDTVEGTPLPCTDTASAAPGGRVLVLIAPPPESPEPEPTDEAAGAASSGVAAATGPRIYFVPLGATIQIELAEAELATTDDALDATLDILLDTGRCQAWVEEHTPELPEDETEGGGALDPAGPIPVDPDDGLVLVHDAGTDDEAFPEDEEVPGCPSP